MPFLLFGEIQLGALVRRGKVYCLDLAIIEQIDVWTFGADLLVGSLVVGSFLGAIFGGLTFFSYRSSRSNPKFSALAERSAARYAASSFTAWEFANAKMRFDSIYRLVITERLVPGGGTVLDLGCGQGLMLALLAGVRSVQEEASTADPGNRWPRYKRFLGIDHRPKVTTLAREALSALGVEIETADICAMALPKCSAVFLFDVLHMIPFDAQEVLLQRIRASLFSDGVVIVREADAGADWRFSIVRIVNRLSSIVKRRFGQTFNFRRSEDWLITFQRAGFDVEAFPEKSKNLMGNIIFRLTVPTTSNASGHGEAYGV
jgi:SAM-dependent methyltransferase